MLGLNDNYSIHVAVATVFASAMILVSNNGVADAVKVTDETPAKDSQGQPLAPPGPFGQNGNDVDNNALSNQHQVGTFKSKLSAPVAPLSPNTPSLKQTAPAIGVSVESKPVAPVNKTVQQKVEINEPVLQQEMPAMAQAMSMNSPSLPVMPANNMMPVMTIPAPKEMPRFNYNMLPQYAVPQFRAPSQPNLLRTAPKMQQFKYIPLPVYQANYGQPQPPRFNARVPGYWVPQLNDKLRSQHNK